MSYDYNASSYPVQSATWDSSSQYSAAAYNQMWPAAPAGTVALASPNPSLYSPYSTAAYAQGYIYAYPSGAASGYYGAQPAYDSSKQKTSKATTTAGSKSASVAAAYANNSHHPVSYAAYGGQTQTNTQLHEYDALLSYYGYNRGGYRGRGGQYASKTVGRGAGTTYTNSPASVDSQLTQQFAGKCKVASPNEKARRTDTYADKGSGKTQSEAYAEQTTYAGSGKDQYGGKGETASSWPSGESHSVSTQSRYDSSYSQSTPEVTTSYNPSGTRSSYSNSEAATYGTYSQSTQDASSYDSSTSQSTYAHSTQQSTAPYSSSSSYTHSTQQPTAYSSSTTKSSYTYSTPQTTVSYSSTGSYSQSTGSYSTASSYGRSTQEATSSYSSATNYHSTQQSPGSYSSASRYEQKSSDSCNNNSNSVSTYGSSWDKTKANRNESYSTSQTETAMYDNNRNTDNQSYSQTPSANSESGFHNNDLADENGASGYQGQFYSGEDKGGVSAEAVNIAEDETGEPNDPSGETVPIDTDSMIPLEDEEPKTPAEREYMFPVSSGMYHKAGGERGTRPFNKEEDLGYINSDGTNFYTMGHIHEYGQLNWSCGPQAWTRKDQFQRAAPIKGGFGMKMLKRMGWKPGEGLGKERTGGFEPLNIKIKIDRKGLSADDELTNKGKIKRPVPELNIKVDSKKTKNVPTAPKVLSAMEEAKLREMVAHRHPCMALNELCGKKQWPLPTFKLSTRGSVCVATVYPLTWFSGDDAHWKTKSIVNGYKTMAWHHMTDI